MVKFRLVRDLLPQRRNFLGLTLLASPDSQASFGSLNNQSITEKILLQSKDDAVE